MARRSIVADGSIDRRAFVGISALAAGGVVAGLAGCSSADAPKGAQTGDKDNAAGQEPDADPLDARVEEALAGLTFEQRVWQLFCVQPEVLTGVGQVVAAGATTRAALEKRPVGGILYMGYNITGADQFRTLIADTRAMEGPVPLFLAIDEEGGPWVARVAKSGFFDVQAFPHMQEVGASGDPAAAREVGDVIGTYLADLGISVDFAPVADVLTNAESSIGPRSFGNDPQLVASMVEQVVLGLQSHGVMAAAKHFPGHGDVVADSHTGAAVSLRTLDELRACEFVPFKAAIDAGVAFVMVGHISTPNASGDDLPATMSRVAITDWLRGELGFEGVVVSDSLIMGAVTERGSADEVAVAFLEAGGDVILDPADLDLAYQGVMAAVETGRLSRERIDESVRRILRAKLG